MSDFAPNLSNRPTGEKPNPSHRSHQFEAKSLPIISHPSTRCLRALSHFAPTEPSLSLSPIPSTPWETFASIWYTFASNFRICDDIFASHTYVVLMNSPRNGDANCLDATPFWYRMFRNWCKKIFKCSEIKNLHDVYNICIINVKIYNKMITRNNINKKWKR